MMVFNALDAGVLVTVFIQSLSYDPHTTISNEETFL